jgi:hypothetical protein
MDKLKIKNHLAKLENFAKKLGNLMVLIIALFAGGVIGYYYHHFTKTRDVIRVDKVNTMDMTSVALNERNELMIIDRTTGRYVIYEDSVGSAIFAMYANRMYARATNK